MKSFNSVSFIALLFLVISCNNETESKTSFEDIEKKHGFMKPLSVISKQNILSKFGSIENYDLFLNNHIKLKKERNKESFQSLRSMTTYMVDYTMYGEISSGTIFDCRDDQYILDAGEEAGVDLPYSCRAGACSTCVAYLYSGQVDQSDQSFLDDGCIIAGYVALCAAYPRSDIKIITHYEEEMDCDFINFIDKN